MNFQELKSLLTEIKPSLKGTKLLNISWNSQYDRNSNSMTYRTLKDFGEAILDLEERGYGSFEISRFQSYEGEVTVPKEGDNIADLFTTPMHSFDLRTSKEWERESLTDLISRTGNHGS